MAGTSRQLQLAKLGRLQAGVFFFWYEIKNVNNLANRPRNGKGSSISGQQKCPLIVLLQEMT